MLRKRILPALAFLCLLSLSVYGQVSIAPTNLFISNQERFGTYLVVNGSNQAQEISIDFVFGYGQTDSEGERNWIFSDSVLAEKHSVADEIRAFPQNFLLSPGQRQIVRLRVGASNDIPDGTYWARIKTNSSPETPPIELNSSEAVTARVSMTVEQITGLFYKKGNVTTGVEVEGVRSEITDEDQLVILTDLKRTGNSPFLGTITTTLDNSRGETVKQTFVSTSIYFDGAFRNEFDISDLPAGDYTVTLTFETKRSDVPRDQLVQMETVTTSETITIPQR